MIAPLTTARWGGSEGTGSHLENELRFYVGLHQPSDARHFRRCCIHVERLEQRRKSLDCEELLLDSQAFMKLRLHGRYPTSTRAYASKVHRIARLVGRLSAVTEDYMCEPFMLAKTGLTTAIHQILTIKRYDAIRKKLDESIYLMPVLQGYKPHEYVRRIRQYGDRLPLPKSKDDPGMWVGVGSVCKRNSNPDQIAAVLLAIRVERPDLRLHGFGVKLTALKSALIRGLLYSADSMAWSYHARRNGRSANDWREAAAFVERIERQRIVERPYQHSFLAEGTVIW